VKPPLDFAAKGLLAGTTDDASRAARVRLLEHLLGEGVPLDELKQAIAENRLALLPPERALEGETCYSALEVAERSGLPLALHRDLLSSLGLALPPLDVRCYGEQDLLTTRAVRRFRDLGIAEERIREVTRVLGMGMSQLAATLVRVLAASFLQGDDDEYTTAMRYAAMAKTLSPEFSQVLQHVLNLHLREQTRIEVLGQPQLMGLLADARQVTVCFADLVGFTGLGERVPVAELGEIAERLNTLVLASIAPPVRLVKTIGDAAMLVSSEPGALVQAALALLAAAAAEGEAFPQLRIGIASGDAVARGGDIYGPPVNLASRLTDVARPGAVLTTRAVRDVLEEQFDWSPAGHRRFKGMDQSVELFRVRSKGTREVEKAAERERRRR
jgi:adenylate cyclase